MRTRLRRGAAGGAPVAPMPDLSRHIRPALADALARRGSDAPQTAASTVQRARMPIAPALLASAHPGGAIARQTMHALYERCLAHYRAVIRAHDADAGVDDVGAAAAQFVVANMQALHGIPVTPPMQLRLQRQLAAIVAASRAWAVASTRDRQLYVEKLAILAVLIEQTSAQAGLQGPAAVANVRRAARGYLQEFLGLDPDRLTLGSDGLVSRSSDAAAEAVPA